MIARRTFLQLAAPAVLASQTKARPNVLFILTDQQHIDSISAGGCAYSRTPAMDSLVRNGVSFAQSYCPDPLCSPSRSAIFSGRMASETGVTSNQRLIPDSIPNLGQWFSANSDYETVYSGKWHLPRTYVSSIPGFRVLPGGIGGAGNLGDSFVSRSCDQWLRNRSSSKPFLMVASFLQPHDICEWLRINMNNQEDLPFRELQDQLPPLPANFEYDKAEPEYLRRTRQKCEPAKGGWSRQHWRYYMWSYYRHVEMVDGEIGRILLALRETGHERDTVVVFTADHGEGLAHHQMVRKSISYDEAARVPLVISWPGMMPAGKTNRTHPVSGVDLFPTICDYAGIRPPAILRGRSLRPLVEGKPQDNQRFIVTEIPGNVGRVVRTPQFKYINYANDPIEQLYDMHADPGETRNLAHSRESVLKEHKKLLHDWEAHLETAAGVPNGEWWRNL